MARRQSGRSAASKVIDIHPNAKQQIFFDATERYVGYGGAKAGGKSWAVRMKAFALTQVYPGIKIIIMRQHYNELEKGMIQPMQQLVPQEMASYNGSSHIMTFTNGSTIAFGHWNGEQSMLEYTGLEFDVIFLDEATQFSEDAFWFLNTCIRGVNDFPKRMYITCNPGGVGHRWVKRLFVKGEYNTDDPDPERREDPADFKFVFATVEDNTALMESEAGKAYQLSLSKLPDSIRDAYRYGNWDILGGNYFKDFGPANIAHPFSVPEHWPRYRSFDYGFDMLAGHIWAVDEDGRSWCLREKDAPDLTVKPAAAALRELAGHDKILATYAPPDMWNRQKDTGKTMAALFTEYGVPLVKADNNRVQGHMVMRDMMAPAPVKDPYVRKMFPGRETMPMLMFFTTCEKTIGHLQDIQSDEKNPDDCAKQPHEITHNVDSCRYYSVMRKIEAAQEREAMEQEDETEADDYESFVCGGEWNTGYLGF